MPVPFKKGITLNGQRALNAGDPTAATDLATKQYVDQVLLGINDLKDPVRATSTGVTTLSGTQTVDGVALVAGDRFLYRHGGAANGIYVVAAGAWARSADANTSAEVTRGMSTTVLEGTTKGTGATQANPLTYILTTADPITLGTTSLTFNPVGASGGGATTVAGSGLTESPAGTLNVGAGNGIEVTADAINVDTAVVTRKFSASSAATTNPQVFTHGLGTNDVQVEVWEDLGSNVHEKVFPDVTKGLGTVTVDWGSAPTAAQYRVTIQG